MIVSDVMKTNQPILHPHDSLSDAAKVFYDRQIDCAAVLNLDGDLIGLFRKEQLYLAIANGNSIDSSLFEYMEQEFETVSPNEDLSGLENLPYNEVPVVSQQQLIGMLCKSDLDLLHLHKLRERSLEANSVIDSVHNAIVSIDADGFISMFNPPAERILEMSKSEVIGRLFTDVLPQGKLMDILKSGDVQASQRLTHKNKILLSNRSPILVDGEIVGAVAVLQDISELESISNELKYTRELKEEVDAIIHSSFDGIYLTDRFGKTLMINEAYSRITGIKAEEIVGKNMHELVDTGVVDRSVSLLVIERQEPITLIQEIKTDKTVLVTGNPIFDENGELFRVVTNVRDITELNMLKQKVEEAQTLSLQYKEQIRKLKIQGCEKYVMKSEKSKNLLDLVLRLGQVDSTVLIQGESGVGKEIIAEILHSNSLRKGKPFIRINCGAIPENLLESELFGYAPGAFTGAQKKGKMGLFEVANGGTLFLDEIGELPVFLQVKLLRAIQEREISRVGSTEVIKIDVRLVAATNRDLWDMIIHNQFRKDLFYRLNVVPVTVPPLRDRKEEIPAFISHFMDCYNNKYGLNKSMSQNAIKQLLQYAWPGNVRELENVIERAIVTSSGIVIDEIDLTMEAHGPVEEFIELALHTNSSLKEAVEKLEKSLILKTVERMGSTRKTAVALGVSQPTIVRKAARYGINLRAE